MVTQAADEVGEGKPTQLCDSALGAHTRVRAAQGNGE